MNNIEVERLKQVLSMKTANRNIEYGSVVDDSPCPSTIDTLIFSLLFINMES